MAENKAKVLLKVLIAILIAVCSVCICAAKVPETSFIEDTVESLDDNKTRVTEFAGATIASSIAISALPGDFATPIAETLSNMSSYVVVVLIAIFVERLIAVEGVKIAFLYMIPIACAVYVLALCIRNGALKRFGYKIAFLALAVILVIPVSTRLTETVGSEYLAYVDETIAETNDGADKINSIASEDGDSDTIFEKLSNAFETAVSGVNDLLEYFQKVLKKCLNSLAIFIITSCLVPIMVLLIFRWILKELFHLHLPMEPGREGRRNPMGNAISDTENK